MPTAPPIPVSCAGRPTVGGLRVAEPAWERLDDDAVTVLCPWVAV